MRSHVLLAVALALAPASLGACKKAGTSVDATEAECASYRNKLFSLLPAEEQAAMAKGGLDKPTPMEIKLCRERINSDEVACALKATSIESANSVLPRSTTV